MTRHRRLRVASLTAMLALSLVPAASVWSAASEVATEGAQRRPPSSNVETRVEDLAWLAGHWVGEIGGQPVEEHWSEPAAGAMMGMFRWLRDGQPFLYEHFLLEPGPVGPVMRLRHFHPGSVAWEEKDRPVPFTLASLITGGDAVEAVFEDRTKRPVVRLTYRLEGESALLVLLDTWRGEQPLRLEFRYRRAESAAAPAETREPGEGTAR
jgi:hypothetical protein